MKTRDIFIGLGMILGVVQLAGYTIGSLPLHQGAPQAIILEVLCQVLFLFPGLFLLTRANIRKHRKIVRELEGTLELCESRFRTLHDLMPLPVEIYDKSGKLLKANPASQNFWGNHGPACDSLAGYMEQAREGETMERNDYRIDPEYNQWEDGPKWLDSLILPCPDYDGHKQNVMLIHKDITDQYRLRADLNDLKNMMKVSDGTRDAFLGILSHELRTPLNWIMGFADLIRLEKPGKKITEFSQTISRSVKTLMSIIDSLIDVSMIESDAIRINKSEFKLAGLFQEIKHKVLEDENLIHNKIKVHVHEPSEESVPGIYTDRVLIKKVLCNLVDNAIKYTREGFVEIGCERTGDDQLVFYVKDSGIGISRDQYPVIFEKFRKVDDAEARTYSGMGLGLSVSKGIIEKLGGNLWIESNIGAGSTFYFSLHDCLSSATSGTPVA